MARMKIGASRTGAIPTLTSGIEKNAASVAITTSQQATIAAPPPAKTAATGKGASPAAQTPVKRAAKTEPTEQEKAYAASRCKTLKEEEQWLLSPRGAAVQSQAERLGQVRQALSACR